jgi:chorismate mutase
MIVTQQEIEALLQRYRKLPAEVQERIEAMVEKMVAGLEREAEWAECARRLWRAIFTKILEIMEAGGDVDANA